MSWSCVNPARKNEKENGNVPVVIPKCHIAARLAKFWTGLMTAMLIAERQSPSQPIISPIHVYVTYFPPINRHSKIMGFHSDEIVWFISGLVQIL